MPAAAARAEAPEHALGDRRAARVYVVGVLLPRWSDPCPHPLQPRPERVKTRRYESPRRREQAAATRRQILEAAQRLFEGQGYAATTMAAIAAEAGVALKTVYVAFETKSGLLRALWHLLLRGDEEDAPVADRR